MIIGDLPFNMARMVYILGQDDLNDADLHAIQQAGLRLGISTHCYASLLGRMLLNLLYGDWPIFQTTSKVMPFYRKALHNCNVGGAL